MPGTGVAADVGAADGRLKFEEVGPGIVVVAVTLLGGADCTEGTSERKTKTKAITQRRRSDRPPALFCVADLRLQAIRGIRTNAWGYCSGE